MAKTVTNLVQWPVFSTNTAPPTAAPNGWFVNENGSSLSPVMLSGSAPEFYAGTFNEYAENIGTRLPSLDAGEYTFMIDALIPSAATFTVHAGATGKGTAQNIGTIVGDGVRKVHVFTATTTEVATFLFLRNTGYQLMSTNVYGARVTDGALDDDLGIFSGDTVDPLGVVAYSWAGTVNASTSTAVYDDAPPPDPDPDPEPAPATDTAARVMALLGYLPDDEEAAALAEDITNQITLFAHAYTRGRGFKLAEDAAPGDLGAPPAQILAVIITASARYMANPTGLSYRAGNESVTGGFSGWTMAEKFVLDNYRKRQS